jgi:O-antigen/teichoic acid export membrane protein
VGKRVTSHRTSSTDADGAEHSVRSIEIENRMPQFARNSGFGSIAGLCTSLGSFLTMVIVAHLLGVRDTGIVAYSLWVVSVAACIADLGIQAALARFLAECVGAGRRTEADGVAAFLFRPLVAASAVMLIAFVSYAGFQWSRSEQTADDPALWLLVACMTVLATLTGFCFGRLRGLQQFDRLAGLTAQSLVAQLLGVALGCSIAGPIGAIAGYCLGLVLPAVYAVLHLPRARPLQTTLQRRIRLYALYAWGSGLVSIFVWSRIEVFFLQFARGSEAVGLFSASLTLSTLAVQGPVLLTTGLLPFFASRFGLGALDEMRDGYATAVRVLAFLVCPACFGMAAIMPAALPLIYGSAFTEAVPAATVLLIAAGIGAMSGVGSNLIFAMERSDFIFASGLAAAAFSVLAGLTIVQSFGLMGAVWARAGVQLIAVALGCWFIVCRLRCPIPFRDLARIVLASAMTGVIARAVLLLPIGVPSLPAAVATGIVAYALLSRFFGLLSRRDVDRLHSMFRVLPVRVQAVADRLLDLVFQSQYARLDPAAGTSDL